MVLSRWQFKVIFHPALKNGFVCQSASVQPLTLCTAATGFSFVAICLGNMVQSSAEASSTPARHFSVRTLLTVPFPLKKAENVILSFSQRSAPSLQQPLPFISH